MVTEKKWTKDESYKIQLLRGLSIIAVVCIHNTPDGIAQAWYRPFLNFSVAMFLFISGMLSDSKNWNPANRLKKIVVPYLLWSLIYTVLYCHDDVWTLPLAFGKNLVTGRAAAIMYYVFVYCQFTLLIPIIDYMAKSKYKYFGLLIAPIEIIVVRLLPLLLGYKWNSYINGLVYLSCLGWFTYFYLGYLIGNNYLRVECKTKRLILKLCVCVTLQILEGMCYFSLGETNCGTQLKLSAVLTNVFVLLIAYRFITSDKTVRARPLYLIGNNSFGVYFSHLAIMWVLNHIPHYAQVRFPLNAMIVVAVSMFLVQLCRKNWGDIAKYFAF